MGCGDCAHLPTFSLLPGFTIQSMKHGQTEMLASRADLPYHLYPLNIYTAGFTTKILTILHVNNLSVCNVWLADGALVLPRGSYCLLLLGGLWCFYCEPLSRSFTVTSSTVVLGCPTVLFAWINPGKNAAIWGFPEANPPAEAVMFLLRITPVVSRFNSLTEAVTISTYCLSSLVWSNRMRGPASLTTSPVGIIGPQFWWG